MICVLIATMTAQYHHHDVSGNTYSVVCEMLADGLDALGCHCHSADGCSHHSHQGHSSETRGDCGHCALGIDIPDTCADELMVAIPAEDGSYVPQPRVLTLTAATAGDAAMLTVSGYFCVCCLRGPPVS